jgi:hypothetical protein
MTRWARQEAWDDAIIKNGGKITVANGGIVDIRTGGLLQFNGVTAPAPWTGVTTTAGQINSLVYYPGAMAVSVIDFNTGAAEALCTVTIDGVVYTEADPAVPANGVWTNGASSTNSRDSFVAAINGDTRAAVPFTAIASQTNDSAILMWDTVGVAGNVVVTTTSAARITVENFKGGLAAGLKQMVMITYLVTAQDVLADEINIPLPFVPVSGIYNYKDTTGLNKAVTCLPTIQAAPNRIRFLFAGATDFIAGDYICGCAWS